MRKHPRVAAQSPSGTGGRSRALGMSNTPAKKIANPKSGPTVHLQLYPLKRDESCACGDQYPSGSTRSPIQSQLTMRSTAVPLMNHWNGSNRVQPKEAVGATRESLLLDASCACILTSPARYR